MNGQHPSPTLFDDQNQWQINSLQNQKDPSLYHLPPQNIEAEESLLSAVLVDNNTLLDIVEILSADDFYRTAHQKIFAAIIDLFDKGEPVDLVTLANNLKARGPNRNSRRGKLSGPTC